MAKALKFSKEELKTITIACSAASIRYLEIAKELRETFWKTGGCTDIIDLADKFEKNAFDMSKIAEDIDQSDQMFG